MLSGQTLYLSIGVAYISAPIRSYGQSGITITGDGTTVLTSATNLNLAPIILSGVSGWRITNIGIDGNAANQNAGLSYPNYANGITLQNCFDVVVDNVNIINSRVYGFDTQGTSTSCGIQNSIITSTGWNGITLGGASQDFAKNNNVGHFSDVGISLYEANAIVTGNNVHDGDGTTGDGGDSHWGIACEDGSKNVIISGNTVTHTSTAIVIGPGYDGNQVIGNNLLDFFGVGGLDVRSNYNQILQNTLNGVASSGLGIVLTGSNNEIASNKILYAYYLGIDLQSPARNNLIHDNYMKVADDEGIRIESGTTNNRVYNNDVTNAQNAPTKITDYGTGTILINNAGYNPVGYIAKPFSGNSKLVVDYGNNATMTSSWTYTNTESPKTLDISGGTVTAIVQNGQTLATNTTMTLILQPGDTFSITFSSAPTLNVMGQ